MGYSIRTEQWRFTQWWWFVSDNRTSKVLTSEPPLGVELYAHDGDRGDVDWHGESVNLAGRPEHAGVVAELRRRLLEHIQLR